VLQAIGRRGAIRRGKKKGGASSDHKNAGLRKIGVQKKRGGGFAASRAEGRSTAPPSKKEGRGFWHVIEGKSERGAGGRSLPMSAAGKRVL